MSETGRPHRCSVHALLSSEMSDAYLCPPAVRNFLYYEVLLGDFSSILCVEVLCLPAHVQNSLDLRVLVIISKYCSANKDGYFKGKCYEY